MAAVSPALKFNSSGRRNHWRRPRCPLKLPPPSLRGRIRPRRARSHSRVMARHLFHRLLFSLPALWLVLTLVFLLIHIVPGDPVEQMLGEGAAPGEISPLRP